MWTLLGPIGFAPLPRERRRATRSLSRGGQALRGRIVGHRELGGAQALELVAQPRGLLEVEIGGGFAHARFEVGDHGLEIVPDGGGVLEGAAGAARRSRPARGRARRPLDMMSWI